jgi:hypothetical protein
MLIRTIAVGLLVATINMPAGAQGAGCSLEELQKLQSQNQQSSEQFGWAVSCSDSYLAVGSRGYDGLHSGQGAVSVYTRRNTAWAFESLLLAADPLNSASFGWSLSLSSTTIAIGAPFDDASAFDSGSIYIFDKLGGLWWQTAKLVPSGASNGTQIGRAVALDGDRLIVSGLNRVAIFERTGFTWSEVYGFSITANAVALSGDDAFCGDPLDSFGAQNSGSVTWVRRTNGLWAVNGKLGTGGLVGHNYQLGSAVAVDGEYLAIGAPNGVPPQSPTGTITGVVFIFKKSGGSWNYLTSLSANDGASGDMFGSALAASGDKLIVSAKRHGNPVTKCGAAYVYQLESAWVQTHKLVQSDAQPNSEGSSSVDVSASVAVVGSPNQTGIGGGSPGAVYSGAATPSHYFQPYGTGCSGSGGHTPQLSMNGCPAPSGSVTLGLSKGLGGSFAVVLFSFMQSSIPIPNGCYLLVDPALPPTLTLPLIGVGAGGGGIAVTSAFPAVISGYSFSLQAFAADPANSWGYSATNGMTATVPP